eukprot:SAG11_NODE_1541_length_4721_cov_6.831458_6_plen_61_part_00
MGTTGALEHGCSLRGGDLGADGEKDPLRLRQSLQRLELNSIQHFLAHKTRALCCQPLPKT